MNKTFAHLTLISVTICWSIQYIFFKNIPEDISTFFFLALTNFIGFFIVISLFPRKLLQITKNLLLNCAMFGALLFIFNILLIVGSRKIEIASTAFLASAYIIFMPIVLWFFKEKITLNNLYGIVLTICGLFLGTGGSVFHSFPIEYLYILCADLIFAVYIVLVEKIVANEDTILLSIGQMGFVALFSFIACLFTQPSSLINLPTNINFWIDVLVIAILVRAYSTIGQIYAQKYVSAINVSLIFSTEIIFTIIASTFLPPIVGGIAETITLTKLSGCLLIVFGVFVSNYDTTS